MRRAFIFLGTAALFAISTLVHAADMPRQYNKAATVDPPAGWSGWYVGAFGGWAGGHDTPTLDGVSVSGLSKYQQKKLGAFSVPGGFDLTQSGLLIGGKLGYDVQPCSWCVVGLGASLAWSNSHGAVVVNGQQQTRDMDWLGRVVARAGVLPNPNWLVYMDGGLAVGRWKTDLTGVASCGANTTCLTGSDTFTKAGWTVGGGVEAKFARNLSAELALTYAKFADQSFALNGTAFKTGTVVGTDHIRTDVLAITIGLNWRQ